MTKAKIRAATVGGTADDTVCVHPGGPREAFVTATNLYHKTAQGWRLAAHHATPGTAREAQEPGMPTSEVLH